MEATYQLEVPNAVDTTNADIVSNDRKTLKWDLKKAYTEGKGISVQATFKVYHMMGIAIFVAVIAVLCIVALILLIHSKNILLLLKVLYLQLLLLLHIYFQVTIL